MNDQARVMISHMFSLKDAGLLKVSGPDAFRFLQGQLTTDVAQLTENRCQLCAHCNREGRMISLFHAFLYQHDYYLLMPETLIPLAMAALKKYAIFFRVSFAIADAATIPMPTLPYPHLPSLHPETSGKFLPHEFNLHQTHAISFNKGCYTGQEIIARVHYRGKLKTGLYQGILSCTLAPKPGSKVVYYENQQYHVCGTIVESQIQSHDQTSHLWMVCRHGHHLSHLLMKDGFQTLPIQLSLLETCVHV